MTHGGLLDMPTPLALEGTKRVHRLGHPDELAEETKEIAMPRKKKEPESPAPGEVKPAGKRRGPKPGFKRKKAAAAQPASGLNFAVWNDGSIEIRAANISGRLTAEQAQDLVVIIQRLKGA